MSTTRKTVAQQIEEAQAKIKQEQNALKLLQSKQKEQDRKARNHRLCKRHGLLEGLLPDTIQLTDNQFQSFLEQHIASDYGRAMLTAFLEQGKKEADEAENNTETSEPVTTTTEDATEAAAESTPSTQTATNRDIAPKPNENPQGVDHAKKTTPAVGQRPANSPNGSSGQRNHGQQNGQNSDRHGKKQSPHAGRNGNNAAG